MSRDAISTVHNLHYQFIAPEVFSYRASFKITEDVDEVIAVYRIQTKMPELKRSHSDY